MISLFEKFISFFRKKEKQLPKIKVCWDFLAKILGYMLILSDKELKKLQSLDDHNPKVLCEIIQEYVVPHYRYFPPENQEKIWNTLTYYLATDSEKLGWVFPSHQIPLDDEIGELFYTIVWQELYGTDAPDTINPDDYEEDCNHPFVNSLYYSLALKEKYNPTGQKPSLANVIARLKHLS